VSEAYLAVGFHVPSARHSDVAALDVAAILLGESESARLPRLLRDRDQLVTGAYAHVHALRDPGLFVLSATARARSAETSVGALVDQALGLVDDLSQDELDKARIAAEAGLVRQLETAQGRARVLGWNASLTGDPRFAHVYLDRIRAVRRHDVAAAVHRYFRSDNATIAAILPKPTRSQTKTTHATFARNAEKRVRSSLRVATAPTTSAEKRVVLPNGMTLLVRRDASVPIVAMRAVWRGGQRAEDADHAGASTLLARLITRGCGTLDATQVADRVDRLGGSLGGVSGRNSFSLASEWLAKSWRNGLDLMADCLLEPALSADELKREKRALYDDQVAQGDNPTQVVFRLFSETLYGSHPYARDVLGTPDSIDDLDRASLLAFYKDQYPLSALTLSIVGDVDVDDVIARATKRFGELKSKKPSPPSVTLPSFDNRPESQREVYKFLERAQAHLVIGYPGATVDAKDRFALEVLVAILGGQSGRLFTEFTELRDKQGLVYLSCAPDKLDAAVTAVRTELTNVAKDSAITADELERAKSYLVGGHQIAMQRRSAVANAIAYHEAYGLGWKTWAGYDDAIRAVTLADVTAAAKTYLRSDRAITATVRPPVETPAATKKRRPKK
jgi:zinc protease